MNGNRQTGHDVFETALGWIAIVGSDSGVRRMSLPEPTPDAAIDYIRRDMEGMEPAPELFAVMRSTIQRYCAGEPVDLSSIPINVTGRSPFFVRAWEACRSIPAGETRTYKWLAKMAGSPGAARGAGQAMARNPFPLIVPCHRVVGTDGSLHGFGGGVGLPMKSRLLQMEGALAHLA
ncbi:MAG: methylated-DNA--[protein]-cysteine S-methyltransferase [Dehalococcoidia bacterium]